MIKQKQKRFIIIGCHRSGTSLLSEILKTNKVFIGNDLVGHYESYFYQTINRTILNRHNARWDYPKSFQYLSSDLFQRDINYIKEAYNSKLYKKYLGLSNMLVKKDWVGWKDPRNSLTLKQWKTIHPDLKIIHIYRNPYDVASSLITRENKRKPSDPNMSYRLRKMEDAIELWVEYESIIEDYKKEYSKDVLITIKYEDLLMNSHKVLGEISDLFNKKITFNNINKNNAFKNASVDKIKALHKKYAIINKRY